MKINLVSVLSAIIMLSIQNSNFGQTPNLGTAANYAVFTSIGEFTNVGTTNITGSIGTNAGALTGFPPGIVVGETHVADPASTQAAIDVDVAYTYLAGITCGVVIGTMLENLTLSPDVYCIGAASTLDGPLTLDGGGDPNAIFIIKIDGAFSASSFSNVVLTNSAFYYNVYWQINGAFSAGANSVFMGTALVNGAISLANGSSIMGRVLTRQGVVLLDANTIDIGLGPPLPIEIISLTGKCEKQKVLLKWTTATEINNDYFSICRSVNALNWEIIGKVKGAGNSTEKVEYEFSETYHNGNGELTYYRLKQTDFDGQFEYSRVVATGNCSTESRVLTLYPNPTNGTVFLNFQGERNDIVSTEIVNALGRIVYHADGYQSSFDLSVNSYGLYYVYINLGATQIVHKFMFTK